MNDTADKTSLNIISIETHDAGLPLGYFQEKGLSYGQHFASHFAGNPGFNHHTESRADVQPQDERASWPFVRPFHAAHEIMHVPAYYWQHIPTSLFAGEVFSFSANLVATV